MHRLPATVTDTGYKSVDEPSTQQPILTSWANWPGPKACQASDASPVICPELHWGLPQFHECSIPVYTGLAIVTVYGTGMCVEDLR